MALPPTRLDPCPALILGSHHCDGAVLRLDLPGAVVPARLDLQELGRVGDEREGEHGQHVLRKHLLPGVDPGVRVVVLDRVPGRGKGDSSIRDFSKRSLYPFLFILHDDIHESIITGLSGAENVGYFSSRVINY